MKNITRVRNLFLLLAITATGMKAQLSGAYAVPGTYASISAAIADLNLLGVNGAVTINIAAGFTETAPSGGYILNAIAGASSVNQITFQKNGTGANPLITAYVGTATPISALQDGIWKFNGSDFITVDGINIIDNNTTNPATMEYGFGFFKASATDGCQNNTIKNCVITLSRNNNDAGTNPSQDGSIGIEVMSSSISTNVTIVTVTSASGANSFNRFYSNTIQNCNIGIAAVGFATTTPLTLGDIGNDIGGISAATGNTVTNYGGGGIISPAAGILTLRQYSTNISYNTINNNSGSGINHGIALRGIFSNTAPSATTTINNNTVTINGGGTTQVITGIDNASGSSGTNNAIDISGNLITNCTYTGATSGTFNGVLNSASPTTLTINNNIFSNNANASTSGASNSINNSGSVVNVISFNNNLIGLGTFNAASTSMQLAGIYNTNGNSTTTLSANNNTFQAASFSGATGSSGSSYMIYNNTTQGLTNMNGNNFNNLSLKTTGPTYLMYNSNSTPSTNTNNNTITTGFATTGTGGGSVYGYYNFGGGTGTALLNGNNFSNITLAGASLFYGIYQATGTSQIEIVSNNIISNITTGAASLYGVYHSYGAAGCAVTGNTITNLYGGSTVFGIADGNTASLGMTISGNILRTFSTSAASPVYGIQHLGGATTNIFKNKIYDLSGTNSGSTIFGINITAGTTNNVYNNLVGDLRAPAGSGANIISGINITGGTTDNVSFNTVYLNGSSTGTDFGTSALNVNASPTTVNVRNNIFVNNSTPSGTGLTVAHRRASTAIANFGTASNNNLYYAGTPGASRLIYYDGTNVIQTLAAYKTLIAGRDVLSVTENPTFVSTVGTNANYLNINTTTPTQIESGGIPVIGITDDYIGTVRNTTAPDLGAWEGNYVFSDITSPIVIATGFTTPGCITTGRTFTASLTDISGVATGVLAPRIYYKINAGAYTSVQGVLSSGTATTGVWTFNLVYSAAVLDVISYYFVVQDAAVVPNLGSTPSAGFAGTDVNTVTTPPTTPFTYGVNLLNGVYNVGAGGTFTTLTAAANAYNTYCITGPVTFSLTDALYSTLETFPIVFLNNTQANATNSLLIIPATGVAVNLTPTNTAISSVVKFLNAHNITIDGLKTAGSSIRINNANTTAVSANIWLASTNVAASGNSLIAINNTTLVGGSNLNSNGVIASVDGASPSATGGQDNDNINFSGNTVLGMYNGMLIVGTATVSAGGLDNWAITTNTFGPAVSGPSNFGGSGIIIGGALNLSVTANLVQNISTTGSGIFGMNLNSGIIGYAVSQNTIMNLTSSNGSSGVNAIAAIYLGSSVINGTVNANVMNSIINTNTSGYGVRGLIVNTGITASNIFIRNNFLSDIYCLPDFVSQGSFQWAPVGIHIEGSTGGVNINNNSISLSGSHTGYSSGATVSAPIYVSSSVVGNIGIRNNILSNTYDNSTSTTDIAYSIYSAATAGNITAMDYNNYYVGGTGNTPILAYIGANRANLYALQSNFTIGQNLNSLNFQPIFTSVTDLHLVTTSVLNAGLNNTAIPIAGLTTDIDNQTRSLTTPDIGADEFTASATCTAAVGGSISPATYTLCSTQTLLVTSTNISSGLGTTYNWKVSPTSGGTYTNVASGTGSTNPTYFNSLSPGTYYLVLQSTCASPALTGISNEATVTIVAPPTPTITSSNTLVCQGSTATLTASGALTYLWGSGATTSTLQITPTANTVYTVTGTNVCPVTTTIGITYSARPVVTITPATATTCVNVPATLTAAGAITYTWSTGSNNAVINPLQSVNTTYTATGTSTAGCVSLPVTRLVTVVALPNVIISGPTGICTGDAATFTATGASTYSWSTGVTTNTMMDTPSATTVYIATGTSAAGCISSTSASVNVGSTLNVSIVGTPTSCPGRSVNLTATGANTYSWNTSAGTITISPTPTITTTYSVVGTAGTCSNSAALTITVFPTPTVAVTGNTLVCPGISTTLTASGATSYSWNTTASTSSIVAAPTATTSYTVVGTSSVGCIGTTTVTVNTNTVPIITVAKSAASVCYSTTATFTASGATTYTWANSGPQTNTFAATPTIATIYTVSGTNPAGCITTTTSSIAIFALPNVVVAPASVTVCSNVPFNLTASGATTYTWNGNNAINTAVASFTAPSSTVYTVVGTNANGCINSKVVPITTNTLPIVVIAATASTICALQPVSFSVSGAASYFWLNNFTTLPTLTVSPNSNTVYSVTGTSSQGCVMTETIAITVNPAPVITVVPGSTTVCESTPTSYTASGAITYTWNGNSATTGSVISISTPSITSYNVDGTGANGCTSGASFLVITNPLPPLTISASSASVCAGQTVQLVADGANTYTWTNGPANDSTVVSPLVNTTYTVTGTETTNGCSNSMTIAIVSNSLPAIGVVPASPTVCVKSPVSLGATGGVSYVWSNASTQASITVTPTMNLTYTVTGTDALGCTNVATVAITTNALPVVLVTPPTMTVCEGQPVNFVADGANTYTWSASTVNSPTLNVVPLFTTLYTVSGTDVNNCKSTVTTVTVVVDNCTSIATRNFKANSVSVFPNPSTGFFTTKFEFEGEKTIMITNSVGQLVTQVTTSEMSHDFELTGIAKGIYFVKVSSKQASGNYKIVVE